jgi:hypothetical protein
MKKQTAVEWLLSKLTLQLDAGRYEDVEGCDVSEIANQAKEMEREQIIEAHGDKQKTKSNPHSLVTYGYTYTGEMYYNETYLK